MFAIDNDLSSLRDTGIYQAIGGCADKLAPLVDRHDKTMGPWNARPRRKIAHAKVGGVSIGHSIRRDADSWTVHEETIFQSPDFRAEYGKVRQWEQFDPAQPFPYTAYDDPRANGGSIWNEISGEHDWLRLDQGVAHFFNWIGVDRADALAIIDQAEGHRDLDKQDATLARLVLA